jgi:hypothetical protein
MNSDPLSESKNSKKPAGAAEKLTDRLFVYPYFRPEQYAEYVAAFKRMLTEFNYERVNAGLSAAIDASPDATPTPARIRQHVPRLDAGRQTCPQCMDLSGFVRIDKYSVRICNHDSR